MPAKLPPKLPDDDEGVRYSDADLSLDELVEQVARDEPNLPREQLRHALASRPWAGQPWTPHSNAPQVRIVEGGGHRWVLFGGGETQGDQRLVFAFLPATDSAPLVRLELDDRGPHPIVGRLDVQATEGSGAGVTSELLRTLPIPKFLAVMRAHADTSSLAGSSAAAVARLRARLERLRRKESAPRGPRGYSDAHYRRIALAYLELYRSGVTRGVLQCLAKKEDRPVETVRDWVHGARTRGFLTPGTPGRAGAGPGPRLKEELNDGQAD